MTQRLGWVFFLLVLATIVANWWALARWASPAGRYYVWIATMVFCIAAVMTIGSAISGYASGLIIDNRNMMSLSKLQMLIWTLAVLPALITGAASNIVGIGVEFSSGDPLNIGIPNELLAAIGLAGLSLAASPVILKTKTGSEADPKELADTKNQLGLMGHQVDSDGKVFLKTQRKDASWKDLFRGDEVGNADTPDLGKIQQFFVTALLAGAYVSAIGSMFADDGFVQALPKLSEKFVWLLAVSHGTNLAYQAAPHTKDADKSSAAATRRGKEPTAEGNAPPPH
jgi:hypothetical protein